MSTQQLQVSSGRFIESPQILPTFFAVVLASSLVQFNDILFPPKITSLNFWAILAVYYGAFSTWFGTVRVGRNRPFSDRPMARLWLTLMTMVLVSYLGLMFFASQITNSLFNYMWGWVALFVFYLSNYYFRGRETGLPEPVGHCAIFGFLVLINATTYSILALVFPLVPDVVNWVFVFVAFALIVTYRQLLTGRLHAWQPDTAEQH
jgi:hypothetical protein